MYDICTEFISYWFHYWIHELIYFAGYKEHISQWILFSKPSEVLSGFTCANAIGKSWIMCLVISILRSVLSVDGNLNIPLWKH